ncbi:MAG TPA: magnesium transporter, partial [Halanaerobiales bacterium]|nr:magnesium transporter [Halanaerobiales bacterium]
MDKDLLEFLPGEYNTIDEFLAEVYPADIAEFLSNIDEELIKEIITEKMDTTLLAEVIAYLDYDYRKIVSRCLTDSGLSKILSLMYADDATDFLGAMPVGKVKNILKKMKQEQASELQRLLGYDDESAGGLMTT